VDAARLLEETGRIDEAVAMQLRRYGLEPGGQIARKWP
jgi:hypothetical protein